MNPNFNDNEDDQLRALFHTAEPPLPDAGFSARVLNALPPPRVRRRSMLPWAAAGAVVGMVVPIVKIRSASELAQAVNGFWSAWDVTPNGQVEPMLWLALLVTAVSLGAAWLVVRQHTGSGPGGLFRFLRRF